MGQGRRSKAARSPSSPSAASWTVKPWPWSRSRRKRRKNELSSTTSTLRNASGNASNVGSRAAVLGRLGGGPRPPLGGELRRRAERRRGGGRGRLGWGRLARLRRETGPAAASLEDAGD